ncbi:penicillin-binding transpeptidase domain-containing protein, partial [Escherichia coli]|uniref:penicillin-binding transpeptidase domain-containing protein n=2 Tax=Gammaproteobacteria TaxID=1236 RepID=UPI002163536D
MFPKNAWYVACTPDELAGKPLGRRICDEPMVFYRGEDGRVAALEDFCPHRGAPLSLGFPGENPGYLPFHEKWSNIATASMSFGYSLAVNTAELAQAYSVFANDGKLVPLSLLRDNPQNQVRQAMDPQIARRIRAMLQTVVEDPKGVVRARVPGYHVAGKSGT